MPLTARFNGERIDLVDQHDDALWERVRAVGHSPLACLGCDGTMHARSHHTTGLRYFQHNPGQLSSDCPSQGESPEHLFWKFMLADAAIRLGWQADVEVAGSTHGERWRADALASLGGRKIALEVQLSSQSEPMARHRQGRYAGADIETLWFVRSLPIWALQMGSLTVELDNGAPMLRGPWLAYPPPEPPRRGVTRPFRTTEQRPLDEALAAVLAGRLVWYSSQNMVRVGWIDPQELAAFEHDAVDILRAERDEQTSEWRVAARAQRRRERILQQGRREATVEVQQVRVVQTLRVRAGTLLGESVVEVFDGGDEFGGGTVLVCQSGRILIAVPRYTAVAESSAVQELLAQASAVIVDRRWTADELSKAGLVNVVLVEDLAKAASHPTLR